MYDVKNIAFHDIAIYKGKGWFYNIGYNAILQIDLETGQLKLEAFIPEKRPKRRESFKAIAYFNEKLYLAPWKDNRLCIYDLRKKESCFIDLDFEKYGEEINFNLFNQVEIIDNNVYFFPGRFPAIVRLNPVDNSLEYIDFWYGELSTGWDEGKRDIVIFNKVIVGNAGWCEMPCWRSNVILRLNVLSNDFSIIESGFSGEFSSIVEIGEKCIGGFKNSNSLYEISDKGAVEISLKAERDDGCFFYGFHSNICIIPIYGKRMDVYNLDTYEKRMSYEFPDVVSDSQKWLSYKNMSLCNKKIDDHRLISYSNRSGEILIIDIKECSVCSIVPTMDVGTEKIVKDHFAEPFRKKVFYENSKYGLKGFLETLSKIL